MEEKDIERRVTDTITKWAAIIGPVLGIAFGVGIYKASTQGKFDDIQGKLGEIPRLEARINVVEKDEMNGRTEMQVATARFTEQISAINNRMSRMEDLLEKTFYAVNEFPKDSKKH